MSKYLIISLIILTIITCLPASLFANYSISGSISDYQSKKAVIGATVRIEKSNKGAYTNKEGEFNISGLANGQYNLIVSMLSYETVIKPVQINSSDININISLLRKAIKTDGIIVSANKRVQNVQGVPISISIISSTDLKNKSINSLDKALEYVPGIQINKDNVSLRGSSGFTWGAGSRIALLLDGFPLLSGDNGDMKFDALPLFNTERIEIIKGAGSALYGTSAIGGVINIITESPKPELQAKVKLYSGFYTKSKYEQWDYSDDLHFDNGAEISLSKAYDKFGFIVSASMLDEESYRSYDEKKLYNGFAKLNYKFDDKNKLEFLASFSKSEADDWGWWRNLSNPFSPPTETDTTIKIFSDKYLLGLNYQFMIGEGSFGSLRSSVYYTTFHNNSKDDASYRQSDAVSSSSQLQINTSLTKDLFLTYGLDFLNNNISANIFTNNSQQIYSAFAQAEYKFFDRLNTNIGFRLDKEETSLGQDTDFQFSPKLGISYFYEDFKIFTSIGRGFRSPIAAERFPTIKYNGIELKQNPDLKSETSWSLELGSNYEFTIDDNIFFAEISIFQNHLDNFINPVVGVDNSTYLQFVNLEQARIQGAELRIRTFLFGILGLEGSISSLDPVNLAPKDGGDRNYLKYRSKFLANSKIFLPLGDFRLQWDYKYVSEMLAIDQELGQAISDVDAKVPAHINDFQLIYDAKNHFDYPIKFVINAFNIFDYYHTQMIGNMSPTRHIRLQLVYGE